MAGNLDLAGGGAQGVPPAPLRRSAAERLAAWLCTGPLGHLWSLVADVASLWARYALARARARLVPRRPS